jgi:hypothetical protein
MATALLVPDRWQPDTGQWENHIWYRNFDGPLREKRPDSTEANEAAGNILQWPNVNQDVLEACIARLVQEYVALDNAGLDQQLLAVAGNAIIRIALATLHSNQNQSSISKDDDVLELYLHVNQLKVLEPLVSMLFPICVSSAQAERAASSGSFLQSGRFNLSPSVFRKEFRIRQFLLRNVNKHTQKGRTVLNANAQWLVRGLLEAIHSKELTPAFRE